MRDIDEAAWLGNNADTLENIADDVKQYVDMGATWYPKF